LARPVILDELVWKDVCHLLSDPQRLTRELDRRLQRGSDTSTQEQQHKLRNTIAQVQRGIARIIDAYSDGLISKAEFEPRVTTAKERLARLQIELKSQVDQEAQARDLRLVVDNLETFAHQIAAGLDQADWNAKRDVIRTLVKRVELHQEQLKVVYRVDTRPFDSRPNRGVLHYCWRRDHAAPRRTSSAHMPLAILHDAGLEPLADQPQQHPVPDPLAEHLAKMTMIQMVKELPNVQLNNPTLLHPHGLLPQLIQRLMR